MITELTAAVVRLEARISELTEALAARDESLASRDARIAELEKLLEESSRSGKRQAAPFSKGGPENSLLVRVAVRGRTTDVTVIVPHRRVRLAGKA